MSDAASAAIRGAGRPHRRGENREIRPRASRTAIAAPVRVREYTGVQWRRRKGLPVSSCEQAWPSVDPDSYLDLRQPDWLEAEQRGDVVYWRKPGEQRSHVSVHPAREEILAALRVKPATELRSLTIPVAS